jgi:hypothetical protein
MGGLKALSPPMKYLFLLEFHLRNLKHNNSYHQLKIKVSREGMRVQARKGTRRKIGAAERPVDISQP